MEHSSSRLPGLLFARASLELRPARTSRYGPCIRIDSLACFFDCDSHFSSVFRRDASGKTQENRSQSPGIWRLFRFALFTQIVSSVLVLHAKRKDFAFDFQLLNYQITHLPTFQR